MAGRAMQWDIANLRRPTLKQLDRFNFYLARAAKVARARAYPDTEGQCKHR